MSSTRIQKPGFSLVEIVLAMAIMAATMVPIFFFMTKGASDTDFNVSRTFAINRASEILNAMLDNVPFQALRAGIPAYIKVEDLAGINGYEKYDDDWAANLIDIVFPGSSKTAAGYPCQSIIEDPRGTRYKITLRVEDITSPSSSPMVKPEQKKIGADFPDSPPDDFAALGNGEVTFTYLKNPARMLSQAWHKTTYLPNPIGMLPKANEYRFEIELPNQVSENPENFYVDEGYSGMHANAPRFVNPTAERLTQRLARASVSYTDDDNFRYCGLKRLIIEVQWNNDYPHLQDPEHIGPTMKRVHIMTIKADINV